MKTLGLIYFILGMALMANKRTRASGYVFFMIGLMWWLLIPDN